MSHLLSLFFVFFVSAVYSVPSNKDCENQVMQTNISIPGASLKIDYVERQIPETDLLSQSKASVVLNDDQKGFSLKGQLGAIQGQEKIVGFVLVEAKQNIELSLKGAQKGFRLNLHNSGEARVLNFKFKDLFSAGKGKDVYWSKKVTLKKGEQRVNINLSEFRLYKWGRYISEQSHPALNLETENLHVSYVTMGFARSEQDFAKGDVLAKSIQFDLKKLDWY